MEAYSIDEFVGKFKKKGDAAEYLGIAYHQLKRFQDRGGVVVGRSVFIPPRVEVRPLDKRMVNEFTGAPAPLYGEGLPDGGVL